MYEEGRLSVVVGERYEAEATNAPGLGVDFTKAKAAAGGSSEGGSRARCATRTDVP